MRMNILLVYNILDVYYKLELQTLNYFKVDKKNNYRSRFQILKKIKLTN